MRLTMVGTGYVGLVTGTGLANTGNRVTCLDIDQSKIDRLNAGQCPIYEPRLEEMIRRNAKSGRLKFTTDADAAFRSAEVIFICVGTPSDDQGRADLTAVKTVARQIGRAIESAPGATGSGPDERRAKIIIIKSTVPVGTNAIIRDIIAAETSKPFRMASNPEFLKEGAAVNDFMKPDRVVIGVEDEGTGRRLEELYRPFVRQGNPIYLLDIPSAEMVKYAANTMLATKISFINEIAALCEAFGADIDKVRLGMCSDQRIGNKFLYPGLGYGGSCFPKDVLASISMGADTHTDTRLLAAVHEVNRNQRRRFIAKIDAHFNSDLSGRHFAVWGLAFKPGTDDMREAPSIDIIRHLLAGGATVAAYDPAAIETTRAEFGDAIRYHDDEMSPLDGADALVICTEWEEFRHPDLDDMLERMAGAVIFDGRNLYDPQQMAEAGFTYHSIGRAPRQPVGTGAGQPQAAS